MAHIFIDKFWLAFNFYIRTETNIDDSVRRLSHDDIQKTFRSIDYYEMAFCVNYYCKSKAICHVFSIVKVFLYL